MNRGSGVVNPTGPGSAGPVNPGVNNNLDGAVQGSNANLPGQAPATSSVRVMGNILPANLERKCIA